MIKHSRAPMKHRNVNSLTLKNFWPIGIELAARTNLGERQNSFMIYEISTFVLNPITGAKFRRARNSKLRILQPRNLAEIYFKYIPLVNSDLTDSATPPLGLAP